MPSEERVFNSDVRVVEHDPPVQGGTAVAPSDVTLKEPLEVPFLEPQTQGFLEIVETRPQRSTTSTAGTR